jgi:hypothetical protein
MAIKKVKLSEVELGPHQHATLPAELIERIKAYKQILGDADAVSVDEAIDDFRRDLNPEKEVVIWERIAHVFKNFTERHRISRLDRFEVLRVVLMLSTGAEVRESGILTRDQLAELKYNL